MKIIIQRKQLLKALSKINNALNIRPILPILSNILLQVKKGILELTATDLEIQIKAIVLLNENHEIGSITIPGRKFYEIWRNLPEYYEIKLELKNNKLIINSNRSNFSLSTLPAINFPNINTYENKINFFISQSILKRLIENTQFSMANQDIRYYLNGMLFETNKQTIKSVSTDGHRLSIYTINIESTLPYHNIIIPRKGIIGLLHLLDNSDELIKFEIGNNNINIYINNIIFTSKLIDGCFPDYNQVLPKNPDKILEIKCDLLKQAFLRSLILSNKKNLGARLFFSKNQLRITTTNQEQEKSEEIIDAIYSGTNIEICFNIKYILDILNTIKSENIQFLLTNNISSVLIKNPKEKSGVYVIMPMRL